MTETADVVVIGGGMAGASIAAELAADRQVRLLEAEDQPGFHSTGRSAAIFIESYGNPTIRKLNRAGKPFLLDPPGWFSEESFLSPRGLLYLAAEADLPKLEELAATEDCVERLSVEQAVKLAPILKPDWIAGAAQEAGAMDIDVARLHQAYLRLFRQRGGQVTTRAECQNLVREGGVWRVSTRNGNFEAPVVINAAGAWADPVAELAGARTLGLVPMRRTGAILPPPEGQDVDSWPLVGDLGEGFYFKPDAGKLMVSPADETPVPAGDAFVDDMTLAEGLYRFEQATTVEVTRLERSWAGLRTFAPDRRTVVGYDGEVEGFFWFAGQGGYGIQTAPAMAWLGAALARGEAVPPVLAELGLTAEEVSPQRTMIRGEP
ncbi:MAG: NAD(P)/FAD-dependent oxidoreductase [Pseudomonadota bacterium]